MIIRNRVVIPNWYHSSATRKRTLLWDLYEPHSLSLMERVEIAVTAVANHAGVIC